MPAASRPACSQSNLHVNFLGCGFTPTPVVDRTIMAIENHWDPRFDIESDAGNG